MDLKRRRDGIDHARLILQAIDQTIADVKAQNKGDVAGKLNALHELRERIAATVADDSKPKPKPYR